MCFSITFSTSPAASPTHACLSPSADENFVVHTPATFISPLFSTKSHSLLKITHSPHAIFKPEQNP
jgi:hypothetical protein